MGLFKTDKSPKEKNMISQGTILVPDTLTSTEEKIVERSNGPTISKAQPSSVIAESSQTSIPGRNINFVENFKNWTVSPVLNNIYKSDIKIPTIELKEYRLLNSTLWEQAKYFMYIVKTIPSRAGDDIQSLFGGEENFISTVLDFTQGIVDSVFTGSKIVLDTLGLESPDLTNQSSDDPYEGLYGLNETGFSYTLPFYSDQIRNKFLSFSEGYSGDDRGQNSVPSMIQERLEDWATKTSGGIRALIEPGIYIEKTQYYNYGSNLERASFSFPLLNTISPEQINENYQFLFLLIYQNSIFRKDRSAFIPPCIYEVLVPGQRYMKYAYISDLKIDYIGTRRMIEVDSGIGVFKTIVPEAYNVSITLSNMHEENGNFMIRSASNTISEVIISDILS